MDRSKPAVLIVAADVAGANSSLLRRVCERLLQTREDIRGIILFGSLAREEPHQDVDLLVVADTDLPQRERFPAVRRLLADYPVGFDIIVKTPKEYRRWRSVVNHIVYFAEKYGKVLYER